MNYKFLDGDILGDGRNLLFVWCYEGQAAAGFWGVSLSGKAVDTAAMLRGNLANSQTVSGLIASLRSSGWNDVAPGAVPAAVLQLFGSRLILAPVMLFSVGVFPGGFEDWLDAEFKAEEMPL